MVRQYGITSIPHLQVYGPQGSLLAEGRNAIGWLAINHPELLRQQ